MTARAQRRMLNEVKKNPRVSAKDLQKSLEHANISVDKSTIRKTQNKNGVHGRTPRKKKKTPTSKPHPNCKVWWKERHTRHTKNIAELKQFCKGICKIPPDRCAGLIRNI